MTKNDASPENLQTFVTRHNKHQLFLLFHQVITEDGNSSCCSEYRCKTPDVRIGNMVCIHLKKRIGKKRVIGRLSKKGEVRSAVKIALQTGYTHIDCAHIYGNEDEVGLGIKDWGGDRKKIWVTSKVRPLAAGSWQLA